MTLAELLNPWAEIRSARIERDVARYMQARFCMESEALRKEISHVVHELDLARDELASIKHRRSEATSRGNRTRARRRRGALSPEPINIPFRGLEV